MFSSINQDAFDKFQSLKQKPEFGTLTGEEFEIDPDLALACLIQFEGAASTSFSIDDQADWCISNEGNADLVSQILDSFSPPPPAAVDVHEGKKTVENEPRAIPPCPKKPILLHQIVRPELESPQSSCSLEGSLHQTWTNFQNNNTDDLKAKDFLNFQDLATLLQVRCTIMCLSKKNIVTGSPAIF